MTHLEHPYGEYLITTDKARLQPEAVHRWLTEESYWAKGVPFDIVLKSFENSYVIGALYADQQVGYARLITDYATFAYLADVYVETAHRGRGLSKAMLQLLMDQDWVKGLRRIMLASLDAQPLYARFGFVQPAFPERFMEITRPVQEIYGKERVDSESVGEQL